jgi:hypothetical protein
VEDATLGRLDTLGRLKQYSFKVANANGLATDLDLFFHDLRFGLTGGQAYVDRLNTVIRYAFGLIHSRSDRRFGLLHINDSSAGHASADPVTHAQDMDAGARCDLGNYATNLAGSYVECGD